MSEAARLMNPTHEYTTLGALLAAIQRPLAEGKPVEFTFVMPCGHRLTLAVILREADDTNCVDRPRGKKELN